MGGLAHYLEDEGVPTTHISLIRLHTEKIRPPRALWVPFELGRPLGPPKRPEFQRRVAEAALRLLEADRGPVLEDFPEDAPESDAPPIEWACPVSFGRPEESPDPTARLVQDVSGEMAELRPWYDRALRERSRTTVGLSGVDLDHLPQWLAGFLTDDHPAPPRPDQDADLAFRLAINDLKAFYQEAVTAQPGTETTSSRQVADWFWGRTHAARLLFALKDHLSDGPDKKLRAVAKGNLIPRVEANRRP